MQTESNREYVQVIDIAALRDMPSDAATQPVAIIAPTPLTPNDTWDLPRDPEIWYDRLHGGLWDRWRQWLGREGNAVGAAIIIGFLGILVVITLAGVAFAAKELPASAQGGYWLATENNGTVDFLTGIPTTDGSFSGLWYSIAPGQSQPTIVAISGTVQGGVVRITQRDGVATDITGHIVGSGAGARIVVGTTSFKASDWNEYKNAVRNRGGH